MKKTERTNYAILYGAMDLYDAGKNTYSGSEFIDKSRHSAFADKFNYRVFIESENKVAKAVVAQWHVGNKCFALIPEEELNTMRFDPSEEGTEKAFDWLDENYNKITVS